MIIYSIEPDRLSPLSGLLCIRYRDSISTINHNSTYIITIEIRVRLMRKLCPVKPPAETPSSVPSPHGAVILDRISTRPVKEQICIQTLSGKRNSLAGLDSFQDDPRSAPDPELLRPVTPPDCIG
ncbi:hypothetical protein ASPBRDRAFT_72100 [Aspergillus brasiliensis CBS 101740]|uniref:Uncharacterized protein n=1 Tax=Aspergillus brasiliensis (strain CBS 101740 / IMI 381727 / IBT 21946) TaxID=767769 RepID=A0A1L9UWQ9_ASPBC|nr:hypothetical protein ASPBRDRAFT_72100 [Aspergillus brasiliensis CBS 101740]